MIKTKKTCDFANITKLIRKLYNIIYYALLGQTSERIERMNIGKTINLHENIKLLVFITIIVIIIIIAHKNHTLTPHTNQTLKSH